MLNVLSMAYDESLEILEMDEDVKSTIGDHLHKHIFLYGPKDKYADKSYYEDLHSTSSDLCHLF